MRSFRAFTLSELLVSLSILGLITALTLPRVFNAVEQHKKKAIFKEVLSDASKVLMQGANYEGVLTDSNAVSYFGEHMNAAKVCPIQMNNGCREASGGSMVWYPGMVLHNGMHIMIYNRTFKLEVSRRGVAS